MLMKDLDLKLEPQMVNVVTLLVRICREDHEECLKLRCHHWILENDGTLTLYTAHDGFMCIASRFTQCLQAEVIDE